MPLECLLDQLPGSTTVLSWRTFRGACCRAIVHAGDIHHSPCIITDVATNSCLGIWLPTESPDTAVITGSAPSPAPPQPATNLSAVVQGGPPLASQSVVLTWSAGPSNNVAGYNVYRATAPAGPFTKLTSVPTTNVSFTDITVISGQ